MLRSHDSLPAAAAETFRSSSSLNKELNEAELLVRGRVDLYPDMGAIA